MTAKLIWIKKSDGSVELLTGNDAGAANVALALTKTVQTELKAITAVAAGAQSKSSELALTNMKKVSIFIDHGRTAADAFVGAGTEYRIQVSQKATGNDTWRTIASIVADIAAASTIATDADEAAGQTRIECGATLPAVGDLVYFKNATIANSEWAKVIAIDATGGAEYFDILDGLTNIQAAGNYFNKAEQFVVTLDVSAFTRLRVVCNNANGSTNRAIDWRCAAISEA